MKKIIAMILTLVLALSLCACSAQYVDETGNEVEVKDGDVVLNVAETAYVITKIDVVGTRVSNGSTSYDYIVTAQSNEYVVVIDVNVEEYARWNVGDTISGVMVGEYDMGYFRVLATMTIGNNSYNVRWFGEVE